MLRPIRRIFLNLLLCCIPIVLVEASEWRRLVKGSVVLHCDEVDLRNGEKVLSIVDERLFQIAQDLKIDSIGSVTIIMAPSDGEFHHLTGGQIPEWGIGAADPTQGIIFLKSPRFARPEINLTQVVIHEVSHVLLGMALGGVEIERWFDEGFAQYESGERGLGGAILIARSLLGGEILWLDEIDDVLDFRREKASLAYQEARSALDYLVETYGKGILARIIQEKKTGKDLDEALLATTGLGLRDFEMNWYHMLKRRYRWYILMDFPFILSMVFVALFIMAFFATRRRIRKKKQLWEGETIGEFEGQEENSAPH